MDFRTTVPVQTSNFHLTHADKVMVLGSCFAENIGILLKESGFRVALNPFGVLYNPASVGMALQRLWQDQPFRLEELVEHEGLFHSFSHHSSFSGPDPDTTLDKINSAFSQAVLDLKDATCLMITFGTSWVYSLPSTDQRGMRMPGDLCWAGVNPSFSSSALPRRLRYPLSFITSVFMPLPSLR